MKSIRALHSAMALIVFFSTVSAPMMVAMINDGMINDGNTTNNNNQQIVQQDAQVVQFCNFFKEDGLKKALIAINNKIFSGENKEKANKDALTVTDKNVNVGDSVFSLNNLVDVYTTCDITAIKDNIRLFENLITNLKPIYNFLSIEANKNKLSNTNTGNIQIGSLNFLKNRIYFIQQRVNDIKTQSFSNWDAALSFGSAAFLGLVACTNEGIIGRYIPAALALGLTCMGLKHTGTIRKVINKITSGVDSAQKIANQSREKTNNAVSSLFTGISNTCSKIANWFKPENQRNNNNNQ